MAYEQKVNAYQQSAPAAKPFSFSHYGILIETRHNHRLVTPSFFRLQEDLENKLPPPYLTTRAKPASWAFHKACTARRLQTVRTTRGA